MVDSKFDFLAAGDVLTLTYMATVSDGHGGSASRPITVTIAGTNDLPTIVGETDPVVQHVVVVGSGMPSILAQGNNINAFGLATETFDGVQPGSLSNNGAGHGSFFSAALDATFSGSGKAGIVNGSLPGITGAPFVGPLPGGADTTNYLSIGARGTETITFATLHNIFGLYWGSVDRFNTIDFYDGTKLVARSRGEDRQPAVCQRQPAFLRLERLCRVPRPRRLRQGRAWQRLRTRSRSTTSPPELSFTPSLRRR